MLGSILSLSEFKITRSRRRLDALAGSFALNYVLINFPQTSSFYSLLKTRAKQGDINLPLLRTHDVTVKENS